MKTASVPLIRINAPFIHHGAHLMHFAKQDGKSSVNFRTKLDVRN